MSQALFCGKWKCQYKLVLYLKAGKIVFYILLVFLKIMSKIISLKTCNIIEMI